MAWQHPRDTAHALLSCSACLERQSKRKSLHDMPEKTEHCREAAATGSLTQAVEGVHSAVLGQLRHIVAPVIDGGPEACRREMESTCIERCAAPALPPVRPQTSSDLRSVHHHSLQLIRTGPQSSCNDSITQAACTHASTATACTTDAQPTVDKEHCGTAVPRRQPVDVVPPPLPAVPACMQVL